MRIEYSTYDEVSEALLDKAVTKGDYAGIDMKRKKRVKRDVKLTLLTNPKAPAYPEFFIAWYKDHGMTRGDDGCIERSGVDRRGY